MTSMMRTAMLLAGLTALFGAVGYLVAGPGGAMVALLVAAAMNAYSYWNSDTLALSSHNAVEVDETTAPDLVGMVARLAQRAGMPMPRVYIMHDDQPNAFATGRNPENAAVAATTGLLNTLTYEEVEGVMAHELAHIKNYDTLLMTITATFAGAISTIAQFGFLFGGRERPNPLIQIAMAILAPLAAMLVQMAVSRTREYEADRLAGAITGQPMALASALAKIAGGVAHIPSEAAERHPAQAHMFIINPLSGMGMDNLFSTHPATENRIAELQRQAAQMGGAGGGFSAAPTPRAGRRSPWG